MTPEEQADAIGLRLALRGRLRRRCVIAKFNQLNKKEAKNFQNYLRKHRSRIPDYQLDRQLNICIGEGSSGEVSSPACEPRSGSVESWIKQIGSRIKIIGGQWNRNNVPQILKLRCAYLNGDINLGISA